MARTKSSSDTSNVRTPRTGLIRQAASSGGGALKLDMNSYIKFRTRKEMAIRAARKMVLIPGDSTLRKPEHDTQDLPGENGTNSGL